MSPKNRSRNIHKTEVQKPPANSTESAKKNDLLSRAWPYLMNAWIFIPALLYFAVVNQYAANLPIKDDYDAVLDFLYNFRLASFSEKITLLFSQHNEHRILHSRLLYAVYDGLFGHINLRHIIFMGDLQLVAMFLASIYFIRRCVNKYWNIIAFIWGLCIFDLNTYENGGMAMTAVQNYGVVALLFVSMFFYRLDKRKYIIPAALVQAICIFSSGNGLLASVFIAISTLPGNDKLKKIVSIAVTVVCGLLYFAGYSAPAVDPSIAKAPSLDTAIPFFIKMCGAHVDFDNSMIFGIVILAIIAITFPYKMLRNKELYPVFCILGFCLVSMAAISYVRSNMEGAFFNNSRYLIYPQLVAACACIFVYIKFRNLKWQLPVGIVLTLIMLKIYASNYKFGKAGFERERARLDYYQYYYPDAKRAQEIADKVCKAGIYCLEEER